MSKDDQPEIVRNPTSDDAATGDDATRTEGDSHIVPLLPLRDIIVFPHMVVPLFVGRRKSITALEAAMEGDQSILLAAQKRAETNEPGPEDIHVVGTLGTIVQLLRLPDGTVKVLVEGKRRVCIDSFVSDDKFFSVRIDDVAETGGDASEVEALIRSVNTTFEQYARVNKKVPPEMVRTIEGIEEPSRLADTVVSHLGVKLEDKQDLLETVNITERLEKVLGFMRSEMEILEVEKRIRSRVKKQMAKTQKEYYLNEQMRAIQKELGEKDEFKNEIQELEDKLATLAMSEEAREKTEKEIKKLKMMSPMSAEATVVRNYIDWMLALPWGDFTEEQIDIKAAKAVLDEDHHGLEKVKERILEYLAVTKLVGRIRGPILCLAGPPGVGKTSLGRSIARAMGREFVRVSLGGVRDEAEIRGHRRTYIGALPGKVIQSLKKAGKGNPVFLLDEIDKMSADFRGDPASALLEVLDPEQNGTFNDHYLDVDYDLSHIMFVTTANALERIPRPLQDRMEIIRIAGYTEIEKLSIAERFLIPKQREANGLEEGQITFSENATRAIIRFYTKESGVRSLEREIASVCRKVAVKFAESEDSKPVQVNARMLEQMLGPQKYRYGKSEEAPVVGVTTGLAWTEMGGEVLNTECTVLPGKGKLIITGSLGDVMQESAQAAMSYVRSRASELGFDQDFYQNIDVHVHVPEGATPKDGPSAGVTMATCLVSALTRIPVRQDVAMTGEITLRGTVLPIGGLKEKTMAAHRVGVKRVIIPAENGKDLKDIPQTVMRSLEIVEVEHMDQVLDAALKLPEGRKSVFSGDRPRDLGALPVEIARGATREGSDNDVVTH